MQVLLTVIRLAQMPFVLHEQVATGKLNDKEVRVIRTINSATLFVQYGDEHYQVNTADIVKAIADRSESK